MHDAGATLREAALELGVPRAQLARWCADGTIPRASYSGHARMPDTIRLTPEGLDALRAKLTPIED